ncbi:hypothetical protein TcWFU_000958 [Taenia crassiceps]|uniref:Uncharacterized protein n=1 Tax=Taenia crassiceps TaxID=6207 RepID=A0ABR4QNX1_9CEST
MGQLIAPRRVVDDFGGNHTGRLQGVEEDTVGRPCLALLRMNIGSGKVTSLQSIRSERVSLSVFKTATSYQILQINIATFVFDLQHLLSHPSMQEPLNFSRTTAYLATQELAARLLSSLQTHNCGATTNSALNFDVRASSLPRDGSNGGGNGGGGQTASLLPNPWAAFPSNAFLAAAAAAAISMKTPTTVTSTSKCLQEANSMNTPLGADIYPTPEKAISDRTILFNAVNMATDLSDSTSQPSGSSRPLESDEVEADSCVLPQQTKRNFKLSERGRRSRVVIHQFGDAEDHFSKALRNLHVKSVGEYEMLEGTNQQKRVWTLTSTFDDGGGRIEASVASPSFEAQNIADLAVEKHFEKSLATFHAKQAAAAAAAAAASAASTTASVDGATSKTLMDLTQTPFSPSSPSTNSSSDGSALFSPREESGGASFNPKKKWLAQYGDDEGARIRVGRKSGTWSLDDNAWNPKNTTSSTNVEKRSRSCPLLRNECTNSVKTPSHCTHKCESNSNDAAKPIELSRTVTVQSSISSLQLPPQREFLPLPRTISLEVPSLGNSIDFFDDEDEAVVASKSISARESPISSPIAASSGFFTDSTYSLDSTLPVISEAGYFSSNASVSSSFKARHLAVLRESATTSRPKERSVCDCETEVVTQRNATSPSGRCWPLRKRTASDTSDISCLKRSRSVVDTGCGEHA